MVIARISAIFSRDVNTEHGVAAPNRHRRAGRRPIAAAQLDPGQRAAICSLIFPAFGPQGSRMKKAFKTATELKTLIAAEMLTRALPMEAADILILGGPTGWTTGMHRHGKDSDVDRLSAMGEIARQLAAIYRYSRVPGLSRNSAPEYV
jgi:hypothetical protein